MNRVDRLFGMVLVLQHRRRVRATDLANRFGISLRTVYRDVAALIESGVPVVSVPGAGYELMEGYTLPPLAFRPEEATALFLGAKMLLAHTTGGTAMHTQRALERLAVAMPAPTRAQAEEVAQGIAFFVPRAPFDLEHPHLVALAGAIRERRVIRMAYHALGQTQAQWRDVEPERLTYDQNAWYVGGHCRWRQAQRAFRLGRIETLEVLPEHFTPRHSTTTTPPTITARIRVAASIERWVLERQHYGFQTLERTPEGTVMTYAVKSASELLPWVLGWGADAVPLEPPELIALVQAEARRWLGQLP